MAATMAVTGSLETLFLAPKSQRKSQEETSHKTAWAFECCLHKASQSLGLASGECGRLPGLERGSLEGAHTVLCRVSVSPGDASSVSSPGKDGKRDSHFQLSSPSLQERERERKKANSLEVRGPLGRGSHWPELEISFDGHTWSGQGARVFWVGATVIVMAWVDQQSGGGVGLA